MKQLICSDYNELGTLLRNARVSKGLSILKVESLTGISEETIRAIELSRRLPRMMTLFYYARFLGIDEIVFRVPESL